MFPPNRCYTLPTAYRYGIPIHPETPSPTKSFLSQCLSRHSRNSGIHDRSWPPNLLAERKMASAIPSPSPIHPSKNWDAPRRRSAVVSDAAGEQRIDGRRHQRAGPVGAFRTGLWQRARAEVAREVSCKKWVTLSLTLSQSKAAVERGLILLRDGVKRGS
jgi:hypothetical protein